MSESSKHKLMIASERAMARMKRRRSAERRFRIYGQACILFSILALGWLLASVLSTGLSAFTQHWVRVDLPVISANSGMESDRKRLTDALAERFDVGDGLDARRDLLSLVSATVATEQYRAQANGSQTSVQLSVPVSAPSNQFFKGRVDQSIPEAQRALTDQQIAWLETMNSEGLISRQFNFGLFTNADSRSPEHAGIATAIFGSVMIVLISGAIAIPLGIGAAIYLDSFAPRTGWAGHLTRALEVNINNLAAIPSIIFGLLGLAIFINLVGLARSIPLVGGLVMALHMFPTIVIASRSALQAVPESLTDSALSLGASRIQAVFNHKVPVATPAMLTGAIIGMAQALGGTAPLLMIGMVAFVTTVPETPMDPATALPVQIFLWSGSSDTAWAEIASAAIIVLLIVLMLINGLAVIVRERLQRHRKI
ncbi:MAG: DUF3333 domain-containing protein [Pseudomonadota bacterium]